ncbi:hypothetical protein [Micromonospora sp. WMMD1082]|uniref:hypothetical protein n=1 Tax=Micromonospora sp. WMMD1082 TaxID=3016104 RepID=UPI002417FCDA|nr:hypothetical protein [Micromonospora sp. WMMD1082]MDG4795917.1 hypothetical protein [Micromonospora sp. WMMD1082]
MANKMLGKVVAGAALGGASLLVFAPGVAFADGQPHKDEGKVFAKPHAVKAGEEVKLVQICTEPQEQPFVWSKVTGKVKLKPADKDGDWGGDWRGDRGSWGEDEDWKDGKDGKDWKGGDRPAEAEAESSKGYGGGAAADARDDWKGEEHGQDAEGRDWKGRDDKDNKKDKKDDWKGHDDKKRDWADEESTGGWSERDEYDSKSGEREWTGERGWSGEKSDEYGKGDRWEHKKDFVYYGEARVARDAEPGTYKLEGSCGTGELVVLPRGGVDGGDGGMTTGADRGLATAGASLVGAAALGGLVLMRRRRADEFAA